MNTNITDTMKHLLELSKRGVGGEKENATKLLNKLMKKYNISESDLQKEELHQHDVRFKTKWQESLIHQIMYMINPKRNIYKYNNRKAKIAILELTDAEWIEHQYLYSIYKKAFEEELELFTSAFIQRNNIFPKEVPEHIKEQQEKEPKKEMDYYKMLKVSQMAQGIDYTSVNKALK